MLGRDGMAKASSLNLGGIHDYHIQGSRLRRKSPILRDIAMAVRENIIITASTVRKKKKKEKKILQIESSKTFIARNTH